MMLVYQSVYELLANNQGFSSFSDLVSILVRFKSQSEQLGQVLIAFKGTVYGKVVWHFKML